MPFIKMFKRKSKWKKNIKENKGVNSIDIYPMD